jgi:hypothetical protein
MKSQKILVWLNNGCYPGDIMFSCGYSTEELIKILKRRGEDCYEWMIAVEECSENINNHKFCAYSTQVKISKSKEPINVSGIFLRDVFRFTDMEYTSLAHEILHICQFLLPEYLDRNKEVEAEAYYHSHLMWQCLWALRAKPKPKLKPKTNESVTQPNS